MGGRDRRVGAGDRVNALTVGIDVGGTKLAGGVVDTQGQVLNLIRAETPSQDAGETVAAIVDTIQRLRREHPVAAVGIGAAGWVDSTRDRVRFGPHLPWRDEPLQERVAEAVGLPVVVENDANAAAWAEFRFGAGRRCRDSMVLITVGTGLGGGLVLGGRLLRGAHGYAGEPGHQLAVPEGRPCRCGQRGCLEQYASGNALVRLAREAAEREPETASRLLAEAGSVDQITGPLVTELAAAGDPLCRRVFDTVGRRLGGYVSDLVRLLDPELVVLGGGVAEAGELLLAPVEAGYRQTLGERGRLPTAPVHLAELGNLAGVVGAADLARWNGA